jgi:dihydrofolate reductase
MASRFPVKFRLFAMPIFHAIAAMSENRAIGYQGKLPWRLPDDFRWFKHKTMGGTLVMGRKTFEGIGEPLPGRKTIVLSHQRTPIAGVEVYSDADLLIGKLTGERESLPGPGAHVRQLAHEDSPRRVTLWICGGAQIYRRFLPECLSIYLTRVKRTVEGDTFFPEFENDFSLEQVIHENDDFRVEHWFRNGWTHYTVNEPWPFSNPQGGGD